MVLHISLVPNTAVERLGKCSLLEDELVVLGPDPYCCFVSAWLQFLQRHWRSSVAISLPQILSLGLLVNDVGTILREIRSLVIRVEWFALRMSPEGSSVSNHCVVKPISRQASELLTTQFLDTIWSLCYSWISSCDEDILLPLIGSWVSFVTERINLLFLRCLHSGNLMYVVRPVAFQTSRIVSISNDACIQGPLLVFDGLHQSFSFFGTQVWFHLLHDLCPFLNDLLRSFVVLAGWNKSALGTSVVENEFTLKVNCCSLQLLKALLFQLLPYLFLRQISTQVDKISLLPVKHWIH